MMNLYLRERGDANIRSNADLIEQVDASTTTRSFPDRRRAREHGEGRSS